MQVPLKETPLYVGSRANLIARNTIAILFAATAAAFGLVLNKLDLSLVDTLDKHVGDLRIAYGSPVARTQRDDIAIVLINENTLMDYESRSPVNRALLAELVRAIDLSHPKAIGIDIIFDRRTRDDQRLIEVLRNVATPTVLASIDSRVQGESDEGLAIQREFISATRRLDGHVMLARKEGLLAANDSVVRFVAPPIKADHTSTGVVPSGSRAPVQPLLETTSYAFVDVLARAAGKTHRPSTNVISWQREPNVSTPLFATLIVPRHQPRQLKPGLEGIEMTGWREFLKDRIVLIGTDMIDRDRHLTPLSALDKTAVSGTFIHAQALAQRIDGNRDIRELPDWIVVISAWLISLTCFYAARIVGFYPSSLLYGIIGAGLIGIMSFAAYAKFHIDFPSIALTTAWAAGGFGGFLSDRVFRRLGINSISNPKARSV